MSKRKQSTDNRAPFSRDEVVRDVRLAALAMASQIAAYGSSTEQLGIAARYLGVELEEYQYSGDGHPQLDLIPIETHFLYTVVMDAYDYAYQIGPALLPGVTVDERAHEVSGILTGFPQTDSYGEPSPLDTNIPQKLRQVLDTFMARYLLDTGWDLTVTQLALLANMGEPAVRTSLSSEGIKTVSAGKGEKNQVPHDDALTWLLGRRGFVPSMRLGEEAGTADLMRVIFSADSLTFEASLQKALEMATKEGLRFTDEANTNNLINQLLSEDTVMEVDVWALERLANALQAPVPVFVGKAVTALLGRREYKTAQST